MPRNMTPVHLVSPPAPAKPHHDDLFDLIDLDGSNPQWTQRPTVTLEIRQPNGNALVYSHVLRKNIDAMLRQNSFSQRAQTVSLTLHDVPDLQHLIDKKPLQTMYKILIHEGYAGRTVQTFAGFIAKTSWSNGPRELRIEATDCLYFAQQFFIITPLDYQGWAAEDAVRDVLTRCGISTNYINIGGWNPATSSYDQSFHAPPLAVGDSSKAKNGAVVGYQTAAAALAHICDLYGWSFWCDVHGYIEFQYVRPSPQPTPSIVPAIVGASGGQWSLRYLSAYAAQVRYGVDGLPGNLLHVVDHSYSSDEMRNFVGVYDGRTPPLFLSRAPGIPGFPTPRPYTPTGPVVDASGAPRTRQTNSPRLDYWTTSAVVATDQIVSTATVLAHPNTTDASTTDMAHFVGNRLLDDLNREAETAEVVGIGNPFIDLGQTIYIDDSGLSSGSYVKGVYFVTGYQTRISTQGYTTQIKVNGGPSFAGQSARPRPHFRTMARHDAKFQTHVHTVHGHTVSGSAAGAHSLDIIPGLGTK